MGKRLLWSGVGNAPSSALTLPTQPDFRAIPYKVPVPKIGRHVVAIHYFDLIVRSSVGVIIAAMLSYEDFEREETFTPGDAVTMIQHQNGSRPTQLLWAMTGLSANAFSDGAQFFAPPGMPLLSVKSPSLLLQSSAGGVLNFSSNLLYTIEELSEEDFMSLLASQVRKQSIRAAE